MVDTKLGYEGLRFNILRSFTDVLNQNLENFGKH